QRDPELRAELAPDRALDAELLVGAHGPGVGIRITLERMARAPAEVERGEEIELGPHAFAAGIRVALPAARERERTIAPIERRPVDREPAELIRPVATRAIAAPAPGGA